MRSLVSRRRRRSAIREMRARAAEWAVREFAMHAGVGTTRVPREGSNDEEMEHLEGIQDVVPPAVLRACTETQDQFGRDGRGQSVLSITDGMCDRSSRQREAVCKVGFRHPNSRRRHSHA